VSCGLFEISLRPFEINQYPWASAGWGQNGHFPSLEIETKRQDFLENMKLAAQFQITD